METIYACIILSKTLLWEGFSLHRNRHGIYSRQSPNDEAYYLVRVEWTLAPDFDEPDLHMATRYEVRVVNLETRRLYIRETR
jgi:hypothetical protein